MTTKKITMNFNLRLLLILLLTSLSSVYGQTKIILNEEFESNERNWDVGNEATENSEIKLGKYIMENFTKDSWHWFSQPTALSSKGNFLIECNLNKLKAYNDNDEYGLMWGTEDPENCFGFVINTQNQVYKVFSIYDKNWFNLINWKRSSEIHYGNTANKLGVAKIGTDLVFLINDEPVDKTSFQEFYGNKVGFYVGPKIKIAADNLLVKEIDNDVNYSSDNNSEWKGNGSGFFIDSRGFIATNYHVVENAKELEIDFTLNGQKKSYRAKVAYTDKQNDLAVIKIDDSMFTPLTKIPYNFKTQISDVGTNIFALGFPMALSIMGVEIKFTDGKISSKTGFQGDISTYQISAPVQPGSSGCPLFDYDGNLIGIVNAKILAADNVAYAIKTTYLKNLVDISSESITLPSDITLLNKTLTEKIKILSDYVVLIKIK